MRHIQFMTKNMLRVCKYGLTAVTFFLGVLPLAAQDYDAETVEEAPAAPVKKEKKQKSYPMMEISGRVTDPLKTERDTITGDFVSSPELPGVQIKAFNNSYYTAMTDEKGYYTIKVPTFVTSLWVTYEGYNSVQVPINGRSVIDVVLYTDRFDTDYKTPMSASRDNRITDFDKTMAISVDEEIRDRLGADVRSISRSALNGQGATMFINGLNSLNSNAQPLIILDGVVFDQLVDHSEMLHAGYYNNILSTINLDDIASVRVLKNGTAIYGSKAANGVIVIETKRNTSMATRIDFNASVGLEFLPKTMDVMDADSYRGYASELLGSTDTKLNSFKFLSVPGQPYYNKFHNNTDWKDEVYRKAITQNYSLHIQGGDDVANYNLSVGYMDARSTLDKNDMTRFNIRFNTDIVLGRNFTTRFDASYTNITRNLRDAGITTDYETTPLASINTLALLKSPFLSPYDYSIADQKSSFIADADDYLQEVLGERASLANPLAILENGEAKNKNRSDLTQINLAITPKWQPSKNFSLQERFSYTMQSFDERYYTPLVGMPRFELVGKGWIENSNFSLFDKHNAVFSDTRFDWAIPLGAHRLDAYGGVRFMNDTYHASDIHGYTSTNDKMPNIGTSLKYRENLGEDDEWRSLSYYANLDYNYKEKYYLQGSASLETSSRFGREVDAGVKMFGVTWGLFYSIQGAWVISNERWFNSSSGANMLKLNVGYESVGNDAVDNNATLTYMLAGNMLNQTTSTLSIANIGNTKLRWETTNRFNAGFEGNFFNNRINAKFTYFRSRTSNLITLGSLAYVAGLKDYWTNDGEMTNEGFDVELTAKVINERNFKFELGASMGHYKNKLTKLPVEKLDAKGGFNTSLYGGYVRSELGKPAGLFYGWKTNGVFANSAEAATANLAITDRTGAKTFFKAGDMKFVDLDGDGIISDYDRDFIGDPNPDIYGNIFAKFFIGKHWTLGVNFNYSLGNDIYNYQRAILESGSSFVNQTKALNRRWMAEGQVTDVPRITYGDPMGNSRFSDRWIEDGSYLKLKNVTLSYYTPIQNEYIQGLTIWAAGYNLFTLTRYLGNDPEVSAGPSVLVQGIDAGYLNFGRSFALGVKINL